jgi:hypothetical protein
MTRRPQNMTIKKKGGEGGVNAQSSSEQALSRSKTITKKPLTYASASLTRSKTTVKKNTPTHHHTAAGAGGRVRRSSLEKVSQATSGKNATTKQVCVGSKEVSSKKRNITSSLNDTYVTDPLSSSLDESQSTTQSEASLSSLSQLTAPETPASHQKVGLKSSSSTSKIQQRRGEGEGEGGSGVGMEARPNSARKQWASDQSQVW